MAEQLNSLSTIDGVMPLPSNCEWQLIGGHWHLFVEGRPFRRNVPDKRKETDLVIVRANGPQKPSEPR